MNPSAWHDRWTRIFASAQESTQKNYVGMPPRPATDDERLSWFNAARSQKPGNYDTVRKFLEAKNPYRWARIQSDQHWMEKQLTKLGLDPEDARFYL